jgi:flagellar hook-associated protein 2
MSTGAITSSGLGSGLDVDTIVATLVAADRAGPDARLNAYESKARVQISALGSMKSLMSSLQGWLKKLTSGGALNQRLTNLSDTSAFTATAGSSAQLGETQIEVLSIAKVHKIGSNAFTSSTATVGAGTMTIGVGSDSFSINTTATTTVEGLRDAINEASDNSGVTATLVQEDTGVRLVLTSKETGTENALSVTTGLTAFTDIQAATDAQIKVDGYTRTSSSNHIDDVVDGVDIDLLKAQVGKTVTMTVSADTGSAVDAVQNFVDGYNALLGTYSGLSAYDASTQSGGVLMGDANTRSAMLSLRSILSSSVGSGTYQTLSQLGISTSVDGKLTLDTTKLKTALAADGNSVLDLFGGEDGIATRMNTLLDSYTASDGQFEKRLDTLNRQLDKIDDDRDALDTRMGKAEERYRKQFSALDSIVSKYNNIASYLDQMDNERYKLKT